MQFTSIFVSLLLSTAVVAKGNKTTKAVSDKSLCKEMSSLTKLVDLASNTTKLDDETKNNATKVCDSWLQPLLVPSFISFKQTLTLIFHRLPRSKPKHPKPLPNSTP